MASRPRRSAATKANEVISEHARWADEDERSERNMSSRRSGRNAGVSRDPGSPDDSHLNLTVKVAPGKLRQATRGAGGRNSESFEGGEILHGKRNRGGKKSYVVDSSPDDDEEDEIELDDDEEEDAEGDDVMDMDAEGDDVDAEGDEDAEGDIDMSAAPSPARPTIRVTSKAKPAPRGSALKVVQDDEDDDDDDLSDPGDSDADGDQTMGLGDETMADEDAEGEEIEVVGEEDEEEEEDEDAEGDDDDAEGGLGLDSDADNSREDTPDVTKMTKRQRARFEEGPGEFMKLSDGEFPKGYKAYCTMRLLTAWVQRCKPRKSSQPKSFPCADKKWRVVVATSARSATRRSRYASNDFGSPTVVSRRFRY